MLLKGLKSSSPKPVRTSIHKRRTNRKKSTHQQGTGAVKAAVTDTNDSIETLTRIGAVAGIGVGGGRGYDVSEVIKGYDAGKKVSGIKRHIAVDTQGLALALALVNIYRGRQRLIALVHERENRQDGPCIKLQGPLKAAAQTTFRAL